LYYSILGLKTIFPQTNKRYFAKFDNTKKSNKKQLKRGKRESEPGRVNGYLLRLDDGFVRVLTEKGKDIRVQRHEKI
jgi:hypothetical protein